MFDTFKKLMFARQINFEEGRITLLKQPVMIAPVYTFSSILKNLREAVGQKKADEIIYKSSKDAGIKYMSALKKSFSMSKVDMIKWAVNSITLSGWGKVTVINANGEQNTFTIRVNDSVVAKELGKSSEPTDAILAGFFAGGGTAIFEENVEVRETRCIAKGDPYCEFTTIK
jgi:predicted hydrocarbon binding protein